MTPEFEIAIEELYATFSKYPSKPKIDGCPCCVSDTDKSKLHLKKLRDLEAEDLSYYAFKAMTTFGDVTDFKHYLPRIFELRVTRKLRVDTFVVLGKLEYGNWLNWDEAEKNTILKFLKTWWKYDINNNGYFDSELLLELNKLIKNLAQVLENWNLEIGTQGFENFVDLVEFNYPDLKHKNKRFKAFNEEDVKIFTTWIEANAHKLEAGFFRYEKEDKEFSDRISNALYMFENIK